ncbi:unnamed protein product [Oppiella nova]|uniref:U4/U6.U5 small nuclear ribonucleoprotein 27 kDa protein n=1 Tax=Oppiella nova TaxID=334625 RepID=A0A7R9QQK8_9ACAR|nr:unnamed protein product [Oppiella nova]CAG2170200.1 unnamed protein product [Oppiella nova]
MARSVSRSRSRSPHNRPKDRVIKRKTQRDRDFESKGSRGRDRERGERERSRERERERDRDNARERDRPDRPDRPVVRDKPRDRSDRNRDHSSGKCLTLSSISSQKSVTNEKTSQESIQRSSADLKKQEKRPEITAEDLEGKSPEEIDMIKTMGFVGFDTTKGKHVKGNDISAVHLLQKRKYRQYMNRKGGFNRPLDFVA